MPRTARVSFENRRRRRLVRDLHRLRQNDEVNDERRIGLTMRDPEYHSLGPMINICRFCDSLYFNAEKKHKRSVHYVLSQRKSEYA